MEGDVGGVVGGVMGGDQFCTSGGLYFGSAIVALRLLPRLVDELDGHGRSGRFGSRLVGRRVIIPVGPGGVS